MRLKHAMDELGVKLPQLNSIMLSGLEGAQRVRGANPPKTKPTPVTPPERPVWKPRRKRPTDASAEADAPAAPPVPGPKSPPTKRAQTKPAAGTPEAPSARANRAPSPTRSAGRRSSTGRGP